MAITATAISSFIMILAVAISSGFRHEIRSAVAEACPDVLLCGLDNNYSGASNPIPAQPSYLQEILDLEGVESVDPAIWRTAIVKTEGEVEGVLMRSSSAVAAGDVRVPKTLCTRTGLAAGDKMLCYFVGERVQARRFTIAEVFDSPVELGGTLTVQCSLEDLKRLGSFAEDEAGLLEITLSPAWKNASLMKAKASEIGTIAALSKAEDEPMLLSSAASERYASLFSWLQLIDGNVLVILILMSIVAGFNMISGLLILLMRSVSTIGMFKALGMTDRAIRSVYMKISGKYVALGLLTGNLAAFIICGIQAATHIIKLDPSNYFVSFLPVHLSIPAIIAVDILAWLLIMGILSFGAKYVSRIDPAASTRME